VTLQMGLVLSAIAFLGTHFLMSHPLRAPLVRAMGEGPFRGVYSLIAILTFGAMIYFYGKIGREPQLWDVGEAGWIAGTLLMWLGSILFVGSFMGNPALPGARGPSGAAPRGVFAITRHPMMWGFALWGIVHLALVAMPKALFFDGAIILLALAGAAGQDRKKQRLLGDRWYAWVAHTSFIPFARGIRSPGAFAFVGGTILWLGATWLHPGHAAGVWRWIG
jgi:uncharacterized membrane protein